MIVAGNDVNDYSPHARIDRRDAKFCPQVSKKHERYPIPLY